MINFAIIGFGHIGKRHAEHIIENKVAKLVAICDTNSATIQHKLANNIPSYTDLDSLLSNHPELDVLCVCTPNYLHKEHSIKALEAKVNVVVEKPMALSVKDCSAMIDASKKYNKKIFAVKQNRYNEPVALVKQLIENKQLGKVILVQVNCFWNRNAQYYAQSEWRGKIAQDGGCLFTQFSHFVDIMYYLNGDIDVVNGYIKNYLHQNNTEFEDTGVFSMLAKNGSMVNFNFTTCSYQKNMEGSITIIGEKGTVKIGGQYLNTIEYQCIDGIELPLINITSKANDYGAYSGSMSNHDKMIANVIDVLLHDVPITTTAQEGKKVIEIIEKMYHAADR
jgi:UDP-N-acetyl-2-amino-2-deoxyglucuronate dehydrogenase